VKSISSRQNPLVRTFRALADDPDPTGERVLLDGAHLVRDAHSAGAAFEVLVIAASQLNTQSEEEQIARALEADSVEVIAAHDKVFAALSPVKSPSGIAAIARRNSIDNTDHRNPGLARKSKRRKPLASAGNACRGIGGSQQIRRQETYS